MNLADELMKKQALKFQINKLDEDFIRKTLSRNFEGIFNLNSKMDKNMAEILENYLRRNYKEYGFELNYPLTNYEIMFKKKQEAQNA